MTLIDRKTARVVAEPRGTNAYVRLCSCSAWVKGVIAPCLSWRVELLEPCLIVDLIAEAEARESWSSDEKDMAKETYSRGALTESANTPYSRYGHVVMDHGRHLCNRLSLELNRYVKDGSGARW